MIRSRTILFPKWFLVKSVFKETDNVPLSDMVHSWKQQGNKNMCKYRRILSKKKDIYK